MAEKVILFTGYPPFGNHTLNPSGRAAREMNGREVAGYRVVGEVVPCDYLEMPPYLSALIETYQPALIIGSGLAYGESQVRLERVGLNWLDFGNTPDNGQHLLAGEPILEEGAAALLSSLPVYAMVKQLRAAGIPAGVSHNAGGHLCNMFLYTAAYLAERIQPVAPKVGFIHLPGLPEQVAAESERDNLRQCPPSMNFDLMLRALEIVFQEAIAKLDSN